MRMVVQTARLAQGTGLTQCGESQMLFSDETDRGTNPNVSGRTILVVDDDKAIVGLISNYLLRTGFGVLCARSAAEAITVAEAHVGRIDLLLADVMMSGMTGLELGAYLNKRRDGIRVIYMSGYVPAEVQRELALTGAPILTKPFSLADLAETIRDLVTNAT
jgi:CheY-like chemotaxis protein